MKRSACVLAIFGLVLATGGFARAAGPWYVAPNGADTNSCQLATEPCKTIGGAVDKAASGDTIHISAGTYTESVDTTGKSLTFAGAGEATTILDGSMYLAKTETVSGISLQHSTGIYVESAASVILRDMSIKNSLRGILNFGTIDAANVTISNNRGNLPSGGGVWNLPSGKITMSHVTISGNEAQFNGGGVFNRGKLTMAYAIVSSNVISDTSTNNGGAGIYSTGVLTMTDSIVSSNTSANGGGGITNTGLATIERTAIISNTALRGGGIDSFFESSPTVVLTVTNTTISGNTGSSFGGGIASGLSDVRLTNVTISDNTSSKGAAIAASSSTVRLQNTILASSTPANNCEKDDAFVSQGHNLENGSFCGLVGTGDTLNANPLLGPLGQNGGFSPTRALLAGSPAIDGGANAGCPATDQRGVARPRDGDANGSVLCDIGAYEAVPPAKLLYVPMARR